MRLRQADVFDHLKEYTSNNLLSVPSSLVSALHVILLSWNVLQADFAEMLELIEFSFLPDCKETVEWSRETQPFSRNCVFWDEGSGKR